MGTSPAEVTKNHAGAPPRQNAPWSTAAASGCPMVMHRSQLKGCRDDLVPADRLTPTPLLVGCHIQM
jgi:hypothetical protein